MSQPWLNYHHLYYFWRVAREGSLSRAAEQLRLSHSTLSTQIRSLEADGFRQFGVAGFPESLLGPIFPSLSLRWQPQLR